MMHSPARVDVESLSAPASFGRGGADESGTWAWLADGGACLHVYRRVGARWARVASFDYALDNAEVRRLASPAYPYSARAPRSLTRTRG